MDGKKFKFKSSAATLALSLFLPHAVLAQETSGAPLPADIPTEPLEGIEAGDIGESGISNSQLDNLENLPEIGTTSGEEQLLGLLGKLSARITPQEWEVIVGADRDSYSIVTGDTLWDICGKLFGSGFYWPKLWSLNSPDVKNPHFIEPEQVLSFTASASQPPALGIGTPGQLAVA